MSGTLVRRGYRPADREAWRQAREARRQVLAKVRARRRLMIARERRDVALPSAPRYGRHVAAVDSRDIPET